MRKINEDNFRGRYAVLAMVDLANLDHKNHAACHMFLLGKIYLCLIWNRYLTTLRRLNCKSQKGPGGGYILNKERRNKILDIFNAIDEKIKTTGCGNNPNAFCSGTNKKC